MAAPRLNLLVVRSLAPSRTVAFYESLGLHFQEEQHGAGPAHWAAELSGVVFEIYPAKTAGDATGTARLGFMLKDVVSTVSTLRSSGADILTDPKDSPWGLRAVVRDPDGRSVELVQHP